MGRDFKDFVHTGPGTVAGEYLRSFWQPVYRAEDLKPSRVAPLRIMGEDLTLFRDADGDAHVVAARCAHRGTVLHVGSVDGKGIRCFYHGWTYDGHGQCIDAPGERDGFATRIKIRAYPTSEYLGLIWAYLGDGDAPPMRKYPDFDRQGVLTVGPPEHWPCNYFSRLENNLDMAHVAHVHRESTARAGTTHQFEDPDPSFEETEFGIRITVRFPNKPVSYVNFLWPNVSNLRTANRVEGPVKDGATLWSDRLNFRVPVDDENCVGFTVGLIHVFGEEADAYLARRDATRSATSVSPSAIAEAVLQGKMRVQDIDPDTSIFYMFWIEDYIAVVGQGALPQTHQQHLGRIDRGVSLLRNLYVRELEAFAEGRPTKQWVVPAGLADMTDMEKRMTPVARDALH